MTVYLIGDSIRMNAESCVRAQLEGIALVSPRENCESSHQVRANIEAWAPVLNANQLGSERQTNWTLPPNILDSGAK